jgi:hypothetical protein
MASNTQDTLASLRKWRLEQDNSGPFRVYRDQNGNIYHSVTHILKETSDKTGLERWEARLGPVEATCQRNVAATRGNMAHSQAEYLLKTPMQLARSTANKRNSIRWDEQGLARIPSRSPNGHSRGSAPTSQGLAGAQQATPEAYPTGSPKTSPKFSPANFPFTTPPASLEPATP